MTETRELLSYIFLQISARQVETGRVQVQDWLNQFIPCIKRDDILHNYVHI